MTGRYCFSFDRETFTGSFETRRAALEASIAHARQMHDTPSSVFIGQRVQIDPGVTGHADAVIDRMRRTVREAVGERGSNFLARVGEHEQAELDEVLARVTRDWLIRHNLHPQSDRIAGISEHSLPTPSPVLEMSRSTEVTEIGSSEYAG